jgi:hypothetical protein
MLFATDQIGNTTRLEECFHLSAGIVLFNEAHHFHESQSDYGSLYKAELSGHFPFALPTFTFVLSP